MSRLNYEKIQLEIILNKYPQAISERKAWVLKDRWNGSTLEGTAKEIGGITRERVRQLEAVGKRQLREFYNSLSIEDKFSIIEEANQVLCNQIEYYVDEQIYNYWDIWNERLKEIKKGLDLTRNSLRQKVRFLRTTVYKLSGVEAKGGRWQEK